MSMSEQIDPMTVQKAVRNHERTVAAQLSAIANHEKAVREFNRHGSKPASRTSGWTRNVAERSREIAEKQRAAAKEASRAAEALRRHDEAIARYREQYFTELEELAPDEKLREAIEAAKTQSSIQKDLLDQWRRAMQARATKTP